MQIIKVIEISTAKRKSQRNWLFAVFWYGIAWKVKINRKREGRGKWWHFFIVKLLFTCFIFSYSYSTLVKRTWQLLKSK
jgi:hypothetical protein